MVILSPFYNFHTAVYLLSPESSCPLIAYPPALSCVSKYPVMGCSSRLVFRGVLYFLERLSIPRRTHINYISLTKRLLFPLLSRSLAVSLTSFSSLKYLFIAWGSSEMRLFPMFATILRFCCLIFRSQCQCSFPLVNVRKVLFFLFTILLVLICVVDPFNCHNPFHSSRASSSLVLTVRPGVAGWQWPSGFVI